MELRLPIEIDKRKRNKDGTFRKKFVPWNKGKKMKEYLPKKTYNKIMKNMKRTGNPNLPGANRKTVLLIKKGRIIGIFKSSQHAAKNLNLKASLIRRVCRGERNHTGGHVFFYEEDEKRYINLLNK